MKDKQLEMYSRQIMLPEMGRAGQEKLLASSVLICGMGGLGSGVALYLAALGIGRIGLVDGDTVSLSNLNRQILYTTADLGRPKAQTAAERLRAQNPDVAAEPYQELLTAANAGKIIDKYDIVADCLDNFDSRFVLNDACLALGKVFVHAGVYHLSGQTITVVPGKSPCLRCLFPHGYQPPPGDERKGIIGATAGVLGCMQAVEIYKYLLGLAVNDQSLLVYHGMDARWQTVRLEPDPDCSCQKGGGRD